MTIVQLFSANRFDEAEKACWAQIKAGRGGVVEYHILGALYLKQGNYSAAHEVHQMAERYGAVCAGLFHNDGIALLRMNDLKGASTAFQKALQLDPRDANTHHRLGQTLKDLGDLTGAAKAFRQAVKLSPNQITFHLALAENLYRQGLLDDAIKICRKACNIAPKHLLLLNYLASLLIYTKKETDAQKVMANAARIDPNHPETLCNLAQLAALQGGHAHESVAYLRQAIAIEPENATLRSNLIFYLNYLPEVSADDIKREAEVFGAIAGKVTPLAAKPRSKDRTAIRVGLVSGDLRNHPVGFFLYRVLPEMRAQGMEIFAYPTHGAHDDTTKQILQCVNKWTPISGMMDSLAAETIQRDEIDILIDLSGQTGGSRMPMFAYRPAPVQISSWIGFSTTSGMAAMDYMLADPHVAPPGEDRFFTEKLWRLPKTYQCFSPPHDAPAFQPAPCLSSGQVTFGSLNNLSKMTDEVVAAWAEILTAVEGSKLLLRTSQLKTLQARKTTQERFARHGIAADRLILMEPGTRNEALATYGQIDIALDTFPYTGGTTTAEALWMGAPVVTLRGDRFSARMGVGMLRNAGLPDWVADSPADYVAKAVAFALDHQAIAALRQDLQTNLAQRPLFDARAFAKDLADAFQAMLAEKEVP